MDNCTEDSNVTSTNNTHIVYFGEVIYPNVITFLAPLGIIGNLINLKVLFTLASQKPFYFILAALAVSDVLQLCVYCMIEAPEVLAGVLGPWICAAYEFPRLAILENGTLQTAFTASAYFVILVSLERYLAICKTFRFSTSSSILLPRNKGPILCYIAGITIFSILYNIPKYFELTIPTKNSSGDEPMIENLTNCNATKIEWSGLTRNCLYQFYYMHVGNIVVNFAIPLVALVVMNTNIYLTVAGTTARLKDLGVGMGALERAQRTENSTTMTVVVVIAAFCVCNVWGALASVVNYWFKPFSKAYSQFYTLCYCINSSINFLIYCTLSRTFRNHMFNTCRLPNLKVTETSD